MEKKHYELFWKVLRLFEKEGILKHAVLIGSWCIPFYQDYLKGPIPPIRTRDIDFLVPQAIKLGHKVIVGDLLKKYGFIQEHCWPQGYIRLVHPDLIVEFLTPQKGSSSDKPHPLPQLGINAQAVPFLDILSKNTITIKKEGLTITLPHPAYFAVHKLLVSFRRRSKDKAEKDVESAMSILFLLKDKGSSRDITKAFALIPRKWQNKIKLLLKRSQSDILDSIAGGEKTT